MEQTKQQLINEVFEEFNNISTLFIKALYKLDKIPGMAYEYALGEKIDEKIRVIVRSLETSSNNQVQS